MLCGKPNAYVRAYNMGYIYGRSRGFKPQSRSSGPLSSTLAITISVDAQKLEAFESWPVTAGYPFAFL